MRWIQILRPKFLLPRRDQPLPGWMIFPVIFAALYASHYLLLKLPYFWDEAGYYIPAAWDFFHSGSLIPTSTLTNAHPPLPSVYLALWWWADGFLPEVTRTSLLLVASFGLLGLWRLVLRIHGNSYVAFWTVALTAIYPIWFTQSNLAHADIFAAAFTLWGLVYALPDRDRQPWIAAFWFSLAALSKETAILFPITLIALNFISVLRANVQARARILSESLWLAASALPLATWYAYHRAKTGYFFGNPEFLRYNAEANLEPLRIAAAFAHRILHLTAHMNLFVPVLCAIGALFFAPFTDSEGNTRAFLSPRTLRRIAAIVLANALLFSVLGGALLTRYLLPVYPLIILVAVSIFFYRVRYWQALTVFAAAAFVLALFINPPYGIAPEDNLTYARFIELHQHAIDYLKTHNDSATVLTAWPATDELTKPELGYLTNQDGSITGPFELYRIEDFSARQISHAATDSVQYSAALVFSTKYDPPPLSFLPHNQQLEARYFGLHHDLNPEEIAKVLGGEITFKEENHGLWAAVIRFNHPVEARSINATKLDAKLNPQ